MFFTSWSHFSIRVSPWMKKRPMLCANLSARSISSFPSNPCPDAVHWLENNPSFELFKFRMNFNVVDPGIFLHAKFHRIPNPILKHNDESQNQWIFFPCAHGTIRNSSRNIDQNPRTFSLLISELPGQSTMSRFSSNILANWSKIFLEFLSVRWRISLSHWTINSLWLIFDCPNHDCPNELRVIVFILKSSILSSDSHLNRHLKIRSNMFSQDVVRHFEPSSSLVCKIFSGKLPCTFWKILIVVRVNTTTNFLARSINIC